VQHQARPWRAVMEWCTQTGEQFDIVDSPDARRVFKWFFDHSPKDSHLVGALYTGAFHFDAAFWPVVIPMGYGEFNLGAREALPDVPQPVLDAIFSSADAVERFKSIWADCLDYGLGFSDCHLFAPRSLADRLALSADKEIRSCVTALLETRPNPKAMESARMATEMALKAYVCTRQPSLTEDDLKRTFRHGLDELLNHALTLAPGSELQLLAGRLAGFPPVGDRYSGKSYSPAELWQPYKTAQFAAAAFIRSVTTRNHHYCPANACRDDGN